jgi:Uma2 family endonuclease
MATVFQAPEEVLLVAHPNRKRWTRAELRQLIEEGHHEFERYELFDGELIDKMGKNWPHAAVVRRLTRLLESAFGGENVISEAPINLRPEDNPTYRPEPDVLVLSRSFESFMATDPNPDDIVLAIEVADSSLRFDMTSKARAYARAGIREYWVADANSQRVFVHRQPVGLQYASVEAFGVDCTVSPVAAPQCVVQVAGIFGSH